uniref:Uncharacterized protein n=1 Tax=Nelumbo nucifera TaxID=4432 RepID=A0A822YM95_NELNU|nr:TPA_asm: hypothetical protein HUJ06_005944 [Nelumbo nucifera]
MKLILKCCIGAYIPCAFKAGRNRNRKMANTKDLVVGVISPMSNISEICVLI